MIESKRSDAKKNINKVAASLAKNPLQTQREVAKNIGIGKSTVGRAVDKLGQAGAKDDRIILLTDKDFELMQIIQKRKFERMEDKDNRVNDSDVNKWDKAAQARYTIFRGNITDDNGGLKDQSALDSLNNLIK